MKTTKYEQKCEALARRLKPLSSSQSKWAYSHLPAFALHYRKKAYCSDCGSEIDKDDKTCKNCGADFKQETHIRAKHRRGERQYYYGILTTVCGEQVQRHFIVSKTAEVGKMASYSSYECSRIFINKKGHIALQTVDTRRIPYCYDAWVEGSEMRTRKKIGSRFQDERIHTDDYISYPRKCVARWLKSRGFVNTPSRYDSITWIELLIKDSFCEWIAKRGLTKHLDKASLTTLKECRRELVLADRHGYRIDDIGLWIDMVLMYRRCGKDTLNAKWSRPDDIKLAHDHALRLERKRKRLEERKRMLEKEHTYREQKGAYFGIVLTDGDITASVIKSAAELVNEGEEMHHCVASYVDRPDSLIFTVRNSRNDRIATVEWSIKGKCVVQCRGKCNSRPRKYESIVSLINSSKRKIMAAGRKMRKSG